MAKRKKRNAVTLVSLLLTLVVLIGVYVWYINKDNTEENSEATTDSSQSLILATLDKDQLSTLHYVHEDADITLELDQERWVSKEEADRPIYQARITNLINAIDEIKASRIVNESPENLNDYGLDEPSSYIKATQKDGTTITLQIGDKAGDSGYYALVNEDNKVYLVENAYGTGLQYSDVELTAIEELPSFTAQNIFHIDIKNNEAGDFELLYDKGNKLDKTVSGLYSWVLKKPYEEGYTADGSKVSEILPNYSGFDFEACVDYKGDSLSQYGLEDPKASVSIGYYDTGSETTEGTPEDTKQTSEPGDDTKAQITLLIGNQTEAGEYYVKLDSSRFVYTIKADTIDKMLQVNAFSVINSFVAIPNIETVDRIDITISDKPYSMEIKRTTEKNDKGEEETKASYYYKGSEVAEEVFKDVYQILISAKYDAEIKEDNIINPAQPYLSIRYQLNGDSKDIITASFIPYDESFYAVDTGYGYRFFADRRRIEMIAQAVIEFKKTDE